MKRMIFLFALLLAAVLLGSCGKQNSEPQPPEIVYGQDLCSLCGMLIDEPRFAAALLLENGEKRLFDDLGDMFIYQKQHPGEPIQAWFVHDFDTEAWVRGENAFYVKSATLKTPMGHGLAAFEKREAAEQYAGKDAAVLTFEELSGAAPAISDHESHP